MRKRRKTKIISVEECVNRYAESALISAVRLRRYWLSRGESEEKAIEKAVKQATGMMQASYGRSPEKLIELFKELKGACNAFISMLEKVKKERNRNNTEKNRKRSKN